MPPVNGIRCQTNAKPARTGTVAALFCAVASLAVAAAALQRLGAEYAAIRFGEMSPPQQIERLAAGPPPMPGSLRGTRLLLEGCDRALRGPLAAVQSAARRTAVGKNCGAIAGKVLATAPTLGLAHLIVAEVALAQQDHAVFEAALIRANRAAAQEGWLAQRRFDLAAPGCAALSPKARRVLQADARVLVTTHSGRLLLAQHYQRVAALRPLLAEVTQAAPVAAQRSFLGALRRYGAMP